jgi:hypothetical protein
MRRVPLLVAFSASVSLASLYAGCHCSGGGVGEHCEGNSDCDPGLYCDAGSLMCAPIMTDAGPDSGGAPTDGGGGGTTDGGLPGVDSGPAGSDAGRDSGPVCNDLDDDGITDCAGDCDDTNASVYPGAPEICGDGVTNDCLSRLPPDSGCMGFGTYVAPPPVGSPGATGTQADPVDTINEGIMHAMVIGMGVDVYVAADAAGPGVYPEDITMVDGVSVLGGYESATWTNDPSANVTVIDDQTDTGVHFPSGISAGTALSGFTVNGVTTAGGASAVTVDASASPDVTGNVINGPASSGGGSNGININPGGGTNLGTPFLGGNIVNLGTSGGFVWTAGGSVGIRVADTPATILRNAVTLTNQLTVQAGISAGGPAGGGLLIANNVVRGASGGSSDWGFGITVGGGGGTTIDSNDVAPGTCATACIGIEVRGAVTADVTNNVAFGGSAPTSFAMSLSIEAVPMPPAPLPDVLVHSNYFNGAGVSVSTSGSASISVGINFGEMPTSSVLMGRLYDNIATSGISPFRYAVREQGATVDPEIFDSNALYEEPSTPAALFTALYFDEGMTALSDAAMVNALGIGAGNIEDACMVTSPVIGGDFHLLAGSMCIDAGNATELPPYDFEGDTRPAGAGPDIGADET